MSFDLSSGVFGEEGSALAEEGCRVKRTGRVHLSTAVVVGNITLVLLMVWIFCYFIIFSWLWQLTSDGNRNDNHSSSSAIIMAALHRRFAGHSFVQQYVAVVALPLDVEHFGSLVARKVCHTSVVHITSCLYDHIIPCLDESTALDLITYHIIVLEISQYTLLIGVVYPIRYHFEVKLF